MGAGPIRNPVFAGDTTLRVITTPPARESGRGSAAEKPPLVEEAAVVQISDEGRERAAAGSSTATSTGTGEDSSGAATEPTPAEKQLAAQAEKSGTAGSDDEAGAREASGDKPAESEEQEVRELKKRDREVRSHEQAHLGALGAYRSGGASFQFETGPDGQRYAVSGEVPVDLSEGRTPEETIRKMQTVRRAALAPAEPSGADRQVAAQASQIEARARAELTQGTDESGEAAPGEASSDEEVSSTNEARNADVPPDGTEQITSNSRANEVARRFPAPQSGTSSDRPRVDLFA